MKLIIKDGKMLLNRIEVDLRSAIKSKNEEKKNALRLVKGEIPRLNLRAGVNPTDEQIQNIISKLLKSENITVEYSGEDKYPLKNTLEEYLPKMLTEAELRGWIAIHVTLDEYNPRIKAMGYIMKELGNKANGNLVKKILLGK